MSNPSGVPAAIRQRLVDIHRELDLFNKQVVFVQQALDRTFDSTMSSANYAANDSNLKKGTEKLAVRTAALVTAINTVLAPDGTLLD